ncbi:hypothetical protein, partial [Streptomyces sp. NPDC047009]|uniref:hypothetical protein n=1 Tax=Streptomyces sp. NPDC047009 TaxID=3154496 RepID=UPI0033DCF8B2
TPPPPLREKTCPSRRQSTSPQVSPSLETSRTHLDLGAAGVGETHRLNAALADDVNAFAEHPDGGKEGPVYAEGQ